MNISQLAPAALRGTLRRRQPCAAAVALMCLLLAGCGGGSEAEPTGTVSGTVTFNGQPWTTGRVNFVSESTGSSGAGDLQENGSYRIERELPAGDYKVYLSDPGLGDQPPSEDGNPELGTALEALPEKYRSEATTDLTAKIVEGDNTFDFPLAP